jgi:hypothetical protein
MVQVEWVDIQEGVNEPTEGADLGEWIDVGFWVGRVTKKKLPCIVIRRSRDPRDDKRPHEQSGFLCIPTACVKRIFRLKIADEVKLR